MPALPPSLPPSFPPRRPGLRTVQGRLTPCLTLQTLSRGDGLLGLLRDGVFGPRGDQVTVAWVDWLYLVNDQPLWQTSAPRSVLGSRPLPTERLTDANGQAVLLHRDLAAEAQATHRLRDSGLHPLKADHLQWRSAEAQTQALPGDRALGLWSLPQEEAFGDFWAEQVPELQAAGWRVVVKPGFAHQSVPVEAWRLLIEPDTGEVLGQQVAGALGQRPPEPSPLGLPPRSGAWFMTLGVVIEGQTLDLGPILADLLKRDAR